MDEEIYEKLLEKRRKWFSTVGKVYCPCLGVDVIFNSKGFKHLRYDGRGKLRPLNDRLRRLHIVPHVISVIESAKFVFGHRKHLNDEYWELRKKVGNITVTVIVRRVGNGNVIYYSVM